MSRDTLKRLKRRHDLTREGLAHVLGVKSSTLIGWLTHPQRQIPPSTVLLARHLLGEASLLERIPEAKELQRHQRQPRH
jgi:hypothetical protein